jgi:hypothetical protein
MRDHHAMRCSGRLMVPLVVVKYGTMRRVERCVKGVMVEVGGGEGGAVCLLPFFFIYGIVFRLVSYLYI